MITSAKRCDAKRFFARALAIPAVALTTFFLSIMPLHAQEIVDPRSGYLLLTVTDLVLPAGAINIELSRTLGAEPGRRGLLGIRWRLNWESRLIQAKPRLLIAEGQRIVSFSPTGDQSSYVSASGERLVIGKDGRAIWTRSDGSRETFDAQGRLAERDERNGNKIILRYGSDGRLSRIEGPKGSFLQFAADSQGRIVGVETSTGATVRYAYVNEQLAEVQINGGSPTRYAYDASGAMVRIEDPQSGAVELAYDAKGRVLNRRWADGSQERLEYDDSANLTRYIDATGGVTTLQWNPDRRQAQTTDPLGHRTVATYDAAGRSLSITGPTGATSLITYDALGRAVAVENPAGQVTRFQYLGESARVQTTNRPDGARVGYEYDRQGNLTAVKLDTMTLEVFTYHPDGSVATATGLGMPERQFSYDAAGRLKSVANAIGEATRFEYDAAGNLIRETNPLGGKTLYSYDVQNRLVSVTDPVEGITRYEYDPQGRLRKMIGPDGRTNRYEYDVRGRLVTEMDPDGRTTRREYDAAGRVVKTIWPHGMTDLFRYDAAGNLTEWTDRLGRMVRFEYDPLGRLIGSRQPTGLEVHRRYDALGNLVGAEDSAGNKVEFEYDAGGLLTGAIDGSKAVTQYVYDPVGHLIGRTDPRGQIKRFVHRTDGALVQVQEPSGATVRYGYDSAGRLVTIHKPNGGETRFSYDAMGNLTAEVDPLGNQRRQAYDAAGRLVSSTDAMGRVSGYVYDQAGRLKEKLLPDGKRVTYQYDRLGNLLQADDGAFPVRFSYDQAGRPVRMEYPAIKKSVGYEYDAAGLRTKLIYPDGFQVRYEYDNLKRLSAIALPDGKRIDLSYDVQDRLKLIRYSNGITGRWEYDPDDRISKIAYADQQGKPFRGWTYRYDTIGNLAEDEDHQQGATQFQYDGAGQLTGVAGPAGVTRYRYRPGGNRTAVEEGGTVMPYRHDDADRVIQAGQVQLSHDPNGNLVARTTPRGGTNYEFDAEERLTKVVGPGESVTFGYAPTSERIWKKDRNGLTYYVYDGLDLIQELDEHGSPKATYVHGPGIDQPLAMVREGQNYYYHADRLGSIRLLTDAKGQVAAAYDYGAFGELRTSPPSVPNPFSFTGREWDGSTGLYYYRARYYDPALGQFLSPDPLPAALDEPLDHNSYLYVRNNPLGFVDPLGLSGRPIWVNPEFRKWAEEAKEAARRWAVTSIPPPESIPDPAREPGLVQRMTEAFQRGVQAVRENYRRAFPPADAPYRPAYTPPIYQRVLVKIKDWWYGPVKDRYSSFPPIGSQPPGSPPAGFRWAPVLQGGLLVWTLVSIATADDPQQAAIDTGVQMAGGALAVGLTGCTGGAALVVGAAGAYCAKQAKDAAVTIATISQNAPLIFPTHPDNLRPPGAPGWLGDSQPPQGPGSLGPASPPDVKQPPPASPLGESITGGLPGAKPPQGGKPGNIWRKDPGMPKGDPGQIARAGQEPGPGAAGISSGQPPGKGQTGNAQEGYAAPSGQGAGKGSEGTSVPPYWGYPPAGVDQAQPPGRVTMDSLTPGSKGSRDRSLAPPKGSTTGGGASSGGTGPAAPAQTPGATAQKPPAQAPPTTPPPAAAAGGSCGEPLCRQLCSASGGTACTTRECTPGELAAVAVSGCTGTDCPYDSAKLYKACYNNMISRCSNPPRTGAWCVGPGADKTCEARAKRVCGLRSSLLERGPTLYARIHVGDGPWYAEAEESVSLVGILLPLLLSPECMTPN